MPPPSAADRQNWHRVGLIGLLCAVVLAALVLLSQDVFRKVDALATANSDNLQWNLSQVEVEFLRFETQLLLAERSQTPDLTNLRRRYDVFFSRISLLREGREFAELREIPEFTAALDQVVGYLEYTVSHIDGSDAHLLTALPDLTLASEDLQSNIRDLGLAGITAFAAAADAQREGLADTLIRIGLTALALFAALVLALARVSGLSQDRGRRIQIEADISSRLGAVVSTSLDAILVADRQGRLLDYNGAAETIFGYSRDEALGASLAELIVPPHLRKAHKAGMERIGNGGEARMVGKGRVQVEAMRKGGEVFPVELSLSTAESGRGQVYVSYIRDISNRKAQEAALTEARDKALAGEKAKAELLAVMSHEMRTPLNGLLGTMELLQLTDLSPEQAGHLETMEQSGEVLLGHVNDVLEISSLESNTAHLKKTVFDANRLIREIVDSLSAPLAKAGNTVRFDLNDAGMNAVLGDRRRLQQVLTNLIGNAVKFTHGGTITIGAALEPGSDIAVFEVSDTGIGIEERDQARIFDEFVTIDTTYGREAEGTGLGLAITQRIIALMGGEITVKSRPGAGSTFSVALPLERATSYAMPSPLTSSTSSPAEIAPLARPLAVLVVEDNAVNRKVAREMLRRLGCSVREAVDGSKGVEAAAEQAFDVILMDISMPVMDGTEAAKHIRALPGANSAARIIALTANALPEDRARFAQSGIEDVLTKPLTLERLRAVLDQPGTYHGLSQGEPALLLESRLTELEQVLGTAAVRSTLAEFLQEGTDVMGWLDTAVADLPADQIQARVHSLAGSAAVVGAERLNRHLRKMETATDHVATSDLVGMTQAAQSIWRDTKTALKDQVQTRSNA